MLQVLTHGDFNFHNLLISGDKITGVLDWECSDFGAPEQDIVYVQQLVTKHMSWDKFLSHYAANGGMEIRPQNFAFCQAYSVLRTMIAFNRATLMNQVGSNRDIRFMMVTFGINAAFMGMGLAYTRMSDESESVEDAALESGEVHSQIAAEPVLKAVVSHVENTENSPKVAIVT
jgi:Ser/Thr protein kinase RdoA (MazF antagonist)